MYMEAIKDKENIFFCFLDHDTGPVFWANKTNLVFSSCKQQNCNLILHICTGPLKRFFTKTVLYKVFQILSLLDIALRPVFSIDTQNDMMSHIQSARFIFSKKFMLNCYGNVICINNFSPWFLESSNCTN